MSCECKLSRAQRAARKRNLIVAIGPIVAWRNEEPDSTEPEIRVRWATFRWGATVPLKLTKRGTVHTFQGGLRLVDAAHL